MNEANEVPYRRWYVEAKGFGVWNVSRDIPDNWRGFQTEAAATLAMKIAKARLGGDLPLRVKQHPPLKHWLTRWNGVVHDVYAKSRVQAAALTYRSARWAGLEPVFRDIEVKRDHSEGWRKLGKGWEDG